VASARNGPETTRFCFRKCARNPSALTGLVSARKSKLSSNFTSSLSKRQGRNRCWFHRLGRGRLRVLHEGQYRTAQRKAECPKTQPAVVIGGPHAGTVLHVCRDERCPVHARVTRYAPSPQERAARAEEVLAERIEKQTRLRVLNAIRKTAFRGDPAATDVSRVLRVPGFANRKYNEQFLVRALQETDPVYHLRDFAAYEDSPDAPRHLGDDSGHTRRMPAGHRSQSEADWAYAKRAPARGDVAEEVIRKIADYRADDKADPEYSPRHTVMKAQAQHEHERETHGRSQVLDLPPAAER
jgi:hypothetical protein